MKMIVLCPRSKSELGFWEYLSKNASIDSKDLFMVIPKSSFYRLMTRLNNLEPTTGNKVVEVTYTDRRKLQVKRKWNLNIKNKMVILTEPIQT